MSGRSGSGKTETWTWLTQRCAFHSSVLLLTGIVCNLIMIVNDVTSADTPKAEPPLHVEMHFAALFEVSVHVMFFASAFLAGSRWFQIPVCNESGRGLYKSREFKLVLNFCMHASVVQDMEEEEGEEEEELPEAKVPKADVADLRELLRRKEGPSGLFSSADAFIPFSEEDEEEEELLDAEVDVAEAIGAEKTLTESNGGLESTAAGVAARHDAGGL